jgi:hypothetical protein
MVLRRPPFANMFGLIPKFEVLGLSCPLLHPGKVAKEQILELHCPERQCLKVFYVIDCDFSRSFPKVLTGALEIEIQKKNF